MISVLSGQALIAVQANFHLVCVNISTYTHIPTKICFKQQNGNIKNQQLIKGNTKRQNCVVQIRTSILRDGSQSQTIMQVTFLNPGSLRPGCGYPVLWKTNSAPGQRYNH